MPRILILGATGYIGLNLANALTRTGGYLVYGLARSPAKAAALELQEIIPVLEADWVDAIEQEHIDVVVDVTGANKESRAILHSVLAAGKKRLDAHAQAGIKGPKLGYIYTSGTWVHGSSRERISDLDVVGAPHSQTTPPSLVTWRPALEQEVLAADSVLDVMVLRPTLVYGREGAIWSSIFGPVYEAAQKGAATAQVPIAPDSIPGLVHVDDLAEGMRLAIDKLTVVASASSSVYPIFDFQTSFESMQVIAEEFGRQIGFKGKVELVGPGQHPFMQALGTTFNGDSGRAKLILGWQPKRLSMAGGMRLFAKAWIAAQSKA